jgi:glycosyltransferase involved in cell wall biosynthesis
MEEINNTSEIAILMATYNGEKYLKEQIDSIIAQTFQNWHLYVHDDGSKDCTVSIINEYIDKYPEKISLMNYPSQGGACMNFLSMLNQVISQYYMFCDQDDVWLPEKIEKEYDCIKKLEESNSDKPIIINTDLIVVDKNKVTINPSFWNYEHIYPMWIKHYYDYAALQFVTGCTMLFNNKVKECMKSTYNKATMHDAWIALSVAAAGGIVHNMTVPYILYRQHENNTLGAENAEKLTISYRLLHAKNRLALNKKYFMEMNAIKKISIINYIWAKIRYIVYTNLYLNHRPTE